MAIEKVNNNLDISASEAARIIRSKNISAEEKGAIVDKFGEEQVQKWLSVDHNDYDVELDDTLKENAKQNGKANAAEKIGYDGSKTHGATGDLALSGGAVVLQGATCYSQIAAEKGAEKGLAKGVNLGGSKGQKSSYGDIATVVITTGILAKYMIQKPNKEQHDAAVQLRDSQLPQEQASLKKTQDDLADTSDRIVDKTEQAEGVNEDAADTIEEDKTNLDIQKSRFKKLKAKKESGAALTEDEKLEYRNLSRTTMKELSKDIKDTKEEASDEIGDIKSEIEDEQSSFDDSAENISATEGVTEYAAGFDENGKTQSTLEAVAMGLNGLSAGIAAAKLAAKAATTFGATAAFAAVGAATAVASTVYNPVGGKGAMLEQMDYASDFKEEISVRGETETATEQTQEIYEDELDNFVDNMDYVENDLRIDDPDDTSYPGGEDSSEGEVEAESSLTTVVAEQQEQKKQKNNNNTAGNQQNSRIGLFSPTPAAAAGASEGTTVTPQPAVQDTANEQQTTTPVAEDKKDDKKNDDPKKDDEKIN